MYAGTEAARELEASAQWAELKDRMAKSLVILCAPVEAWLFDDGVRLIPDDLEEWTRVHHAFCGALRDNGLQYDILGHEIQDLAQRGGICSIEVTGIVSTVRRETAECSAIHTVCAHLSTAGWLLVLFTFHLPCIGPVPMACQSSTAIAQ